MYIVITTMGNLRYWTTGCAHNIKALAFVLGTQLIGNGVKLAYG